MDSIVAEFVQEEDQLTLESRVSDVEALLRTIGRFKTITPSTRIFEIGVGSGWFQIICKKKGLNCKGLEVNPTVASYAEERGRKNGVQLEILLGDAGDTDLGSGLYDVIIANSVFEHVRDWQPGIGAAFKSLAPGGVFYFYSTNKFSFKSGEYDFPLYGWWPDSWRYRLRIARQGEQIMEWGIDYNQFTFVQLRRYFKCLGFSQVLDTVDILHQNHLNHPTVKKKLIVKTLKTFKPLKHAALLFAPGTSFICIK